MENDSERCICQYCGKKFDKNFKLRGFTVICPNCDKPQPNIKTENDN